MDNLLIRLTAHKQNKNTTLYLFLAAVLCLLYLNMGQYLGGVQLFSSGSILIIRFALIVFSFSLSVIFLYKYIAFSKVSVLGAGTLFYFSSLIPSLLNAGMYDSFIASFCSQSFWFACFLFFCVFTESSRKVDYDFIAKILGVAFWIFAVRYFIWLVSDAEEISGSLNCVYYSLLLLPCALMMKSIVFKVGIIGMSMVNVVISGKRTAFIVLILALIVPFIIELFGQRKGKTLVTVIVGIVAIALIYKYISGVYDIAVFDRLDTLGEDKGAGRLDIFKDVLNAFKESSFFDKMIGHGFNAVYLNGAAWTSAHNDFIEILYDFGYIGIILYGAFLIKLIINAFRLYRMGSRMASAYTSALITLFVMSMSSNLILYPTYIVFLMLFFILGINDLNRS